MRGKAAEENNYNKMQDREAMYDGTKKIKPSESANKKAHVTKNANTVRNIVFELIESEVDSNVPMPRVTAKHEEDAEAANIIEDYLRAQVKRLHMKTLNDIDERTTYMQGGNYFLVEWDNSQRTHTNIGDISVQLVHPLQIVPQEGIKQLDDMDYIILRIAMTKSAIYRKYGVNVQMETGQDELATTEEMVTMNVAYYKNEAGHIGRFTWAGDTVIEDIEDFQTRQLPKCKECGAVIEDGVCPQCGSRKYTAAPVDEIPVYEDLKIAGNEIIKPFDEMATMAVAPDGMPLTREDEEGAGQPVVLGAQVRNQIPVYRPGMIPVVLRKNVSQYGKLLGSSDVDTIMDQQETIKKLGTKINEKLMKAGSYVTLPTGVDVEISDKELKIIRLENPQQKSMIDTINIQPNVNTDLTVLEQNYQWAKSALGITDSFQGKSDSTAVSGTAKQFAAAQSAGRLESKRQMKNEAYTKLYELIFKFALAYADEPVQVPAIDRKGDKTYSTFDRYQFLKRDAAGELYWNDEFLFSVDTTGGLAQNREAMWAQIDAKYTSGAMGNPDDIATRINYWKLLEQNQFPMASNMRAILEEQQYQQVEQMQQMAQSQENAVNVPTEEMLAEMQAAGDVAAWEGGESLAMPTMQS